MTKVLKPVPAVFLALVAVACNGANIIGPANQLEVSTAADNFQFQVSSLTNVTQDLSYTWVNSGTQATVDISQAITGGSAVLTIRDAAGTVVHQEDIGNDNDTDTTVGVDGNWTIEIRLNGVSGTFNFRVQRKT